ncbi:hypothetical protein MMC21_005842 [Puttea exsequens]|nr:hypothetical protein [Puttea exsequens]
MASNARASLSSLSPSEVRRSIGERRPSTPESLRSSTSAHRASSAAFQSPPLPPPISLRRASGSYQLPPLPPSTDSLVTGTNIPPPALTAPIPPPKDQAPAPKPLLMPTTPQRKPVLRQKSPLSNEAYSSPASSMPGAFPETPSATGTPQNNGLQNSQFSATAYSENEAPTPNSKSPKRPGSLRNLLSFKKMRKSLGNSSPISADSRPRSPGMESTLSSGQPTLIKKKSGTFWKRSSSFGMMSYGKEGEIEHRPSTPGLSGDTVMEEDASIRSPTLTSNEGLFAKGRRKSGTFWRRSSMGLATAFNAGGAKEGAGETTNGTNKFTNGSEAANGSPTAGKPNGVNGSHDGVNVPMTGTDKQLPDIPLSPVTNLEEIDFTPTRSYSPPPQLPELVGGGGGLGGEDLFKDIQ